MFIDRKNSSSPLYACRSLLANAGLVLQMIKRDVIGRYRGSVMGLTWSFFNPLLMLAIYTLVFSVIFETKWPGIGRDKSRVDFAVIFFSGLVIYGLVAECVNRAPSLVTGNANYVKKVVFPLEILPVVAVGSALFHMAVSVVVLLAAQLFLTHHLPWTAVLFPLAMVPLVIGTLGIAWFLASLGVYLRDVAQVTGMMMTMLLFLSPIFFPAEAMPASIRGWLSLNPLVYFLDAGRDTLIYGRVPSIGGALIALAGSLAVAWAGFAFFQKSRRGFADVL